MELQVEQKLMGEKELDLVLEILNMKFYLLFNVTNVIK
jgi:hypothetical protein